MADDDLDQLLDEVEKKFCRNVSVACSARKDESEKSHEDMREQRKDRAIKPGQPMSSVSEDIDALLEELLEDDYSDSPASKFQTEQFAKGPQVEKKLSTQSGGRKCCPVFLGGSSVTNGVGTATSKRSCDQLRCVSCDFRVLTFDDSEWDASCDYLFLRNNMPDSLKLRTKLRKRRGSRAYGCQCSWSSASEITDVRDRPQLRWVCGKHQD
ncbi:cilia- and flagella-associated protein 418 [Austrofundulus limnaeus]|uniref:Cilia- and flagella-associated protein 418 n=1 Tax=Austrofundulus limnaeus TaxID=52670 RepID=A0A2I4CJ54_AUSLI|nr:PREDICTED: protein C8orf37 homolog [Austrofundulus limnaeus]